MKEQDPKSRELMPIHSTDSKYGISPIPFEWLSEKNAESFHDQTLSKLAGRGGLSVREILFNMDAISRDELSQEVGREETYVKYLKFILAYKQRGEQIKELNISRVGGETPKSDLSDKYKLMIYALTKVEKVSGEAKTPDQLSRIKQLETILKYANAEIQRGHDTIRNYERALQELTGGSVPTPSDDEIEAESEKHYIKHQRGFIIGAKWLRGLAPEREKE